MCFEDNFFHQYKKTILLNKNVFYLRFVIAEHGCRHRIKKSLTIRDSKTFYDRKNLIYPRIYINFQGSENHRKSSAGIRYCKILQVNAMINVRKCKM